MLANFDRYDLILTARKSKKFRELDDQVRTMSYELGKKNPDIDEKKYRELKAKRDKELSQFIKSLEPASVPFDRSIFQKLDTKITQLIDVYLKKFPNTKLTNIVLSGPTGTGKTYCANLIQHDLTENGFNIHLVSTFNLVKRMKNHLYGQDYAVTEDFFNSDLLIIDDLGAEPSIKDSDDMIYTVINDRYSNCKPFIITTNLSKDQVQTRYSDRIFGRIYDKSKTCIILFNGKDLRIE